MTEEKPTSRKAVLIWMIVSQVLTVGTLAVWLVMAGLLVHGFRRGRDTPSHDLCDCDFGLSDLSVGLGHSSVDRVRTPKRQVGRNTLRSIVFAAGFGVHRFRSHSSVHL